MCSPADPECWTFGQHFAAEAEQFGRTSAGRGETSRSLHETATLNEPPKVLRVQALTGQCLHPNGGEIING